jgi:hypothetical protein
VTLRIAAALSLILGVAVLLAYLELIGRGPWQPPAVRHALAMKRRRSAPAAFAPLSFADYAALPRGPSPRVRDELESRGVTMEGYVQRIMQAPDGDLHLDLAERVPRGGFGNYAIAEITPEWRRGSASFRYDALLAAFRPRLGGITPWEGGPRRVRLRGPLLHDASHEDARPRRNAAAPLSAWEIHPVTGIELWSDAERRFVEYPR